MKEFPRQKYMSNLNEVNNNLLGADVLMILYRCYSRKPVHDYINAFVIR
jgi:hypothetical protein